MLDISELSRASGFAASKLRYYEELGLIQSAGRKGLKRVYEEQVKTRLSLVSLGQIAGFSLTEIGELLGADDKPELDLDALDARACELEDRIKELTALRDGIRHIMKCSAKSHLECPRFRRIMHVALNRRDRRS